MNPETLIQALPQDKQAHLWYETLHRICKELAAIHGLTLETVAGVLVTFSAQKRFSENLTQTVQFLTGVPITGMYSRRQLATAQAILAGTDPMQTWGKTSFKYRNFYQSILLQDGAVCVDTHIIRHYLTRHPRSKVHRLGSIERVFDTRWAYELIQKYVRTFARKAGLTSYQAQALIWVEQRGEMW